MAGSGVTGSTKDLQRSSSRDLQRVAVTRQCSPALAAGEKKRENTSRLVKGTSIKKPANHDAEGLLVILMHPMNVLLLCLPLGVIAEYSSWGDVWVFWLNFAAMIPLAKILGDATEELAASLRNDMVAGLLNATFGNAVEVVITIQSLRAGMIRIVKTSLLGSVLSNTLLVLGMSFFCGGLITSKKKTQPSDSTAHDYSSVDAQSKTSSRESMQSGSSFALASTEKIQSFSMLGALVNTSMLLVSCLCFSLVTIFRMVLSDSLETEDVRAIVLPVSRASSIIVILAYVAYIVFQLVTHKEAMAEGDDEEDDDSESISVYLSVALLLVTTILTAYSSNLLVKAIEGVVEGSSHLSEHFIGIILLPIVGNACEHTAAVRFAVQDKLGLSVSIAVGSSTQIALFVVPLSVLIGWYMDVPMDLNFGLLNSSLITLSVVVVLSMVVDGQSNWLQGYLLSSVYVIISIMYWNLPNEVNDGLD